MNGFYFSNIQNWLVFSLLLSSSHPMPRDLAQEIRNLFPGFLRVFVVPPSTEEMEQAEEGLMDF